MALKGQLIAIENAIDKLKRDVDKSGQEVQMLQSKLSITKVYLDARDTWLRYMERKAYKTRFEECKPW